MVSEARESTHDGSIVLAIMAQGMGVAHTRTSDLGHSSLAAACAHPSVGHCVAFLDDEPAPYAKLSAGAFRLVKPSEFISQSLPRPKIGLECCMEQTAKRRQNATIGYLGSMGLLETRWARPLERLPFFCQSHVAYTLAAQYRFLPALAFLRDSEPYAAGWRSGRLNWLALLDDDSEVDANNLAGLLLGPSIAASERLYLGDFGKGMSHFGAPFACGGAGTFFSRGAVRAMDFLACARTLHRGCRQSDWMIGMCARKHKVRAMNNDSSTSCALCGASCAPRSKERLRFAMRGTQPCAFAQLTASTVCRRQDPAFVRRLCAWRPLGLAVGHGWSSYCGRSVSSIARAGG